MADLDHVRRDEVVRLVDGLQRVLAVIALLRRLYPDIDVAGVDLLGDRGAGDLLALGVVRRLHEVRRHLRAARRLQDLEGDGQLALVLRGELVEVELLALGDVDVRALVVGGRLEVFGSLRRAVRLVLAGVALLEGRRHRVATRVTRVVGVDLHVVVARRQVRLGEARHRIDLLRRALRRHEVGAEVAAVVVELYL